MSKQAMQALIREYWFHLYLEDRDYKRAILAIELNY